MSKKSKIQKKTIKIQKTTHSRLDKMGERGESFDDIIKKLMDFWEDNQGI